MGWKMMMESKYDFFKLVEGILLVGEGGAAEGAGVVVFLPHAETLRVEVLLAAGTVQQIFMAFHFAEADHAAGVVVELDFPLALGHPRLQPPQQLLVQGGVGVAAEVDAALEAVQQSVRLRHLRDDEVDVLAGALREAEIHAIAVQLAPDFSRVGLSMRTHHLEPPLTLLPLRLNQKNAFFPAPLYSFHLRNCPEAGFLGRSFQFLRLYCHFLFDCSQIGRGKRQVRRLVDFFALF
jgi:hypothetical protein